jgi:two-component system response regulator PilR (NtrC family)
MPKALALVVDDEPAIRELLEITLERMDIACRTVADFAGACELLIERDLSSVSPI